MNVVAPDPISLRTQIAHWDAVAMLSLWKFVKENGTFENLEMVYDFKGVIIRARDSWFRTENTPRHASNYLLRGDDWEIKFFLSKDRSGMYFKWQRKYAVDIFSNGSRTPHTYSFFGYEFDEAETENLERDITLLKVINSAVFYTVLV